MLLLAFSLCINIIRYVIIFFRNPKKYLLQLMYFTGNAAAKCRWFFLFDWLFVFVIFLWFVFIVCGLRARKRNMLFFSGKKNIIGDCLIPFFSVKVLLFYTVSDTTSWTGIVFHVIFNKTVRPRLYALVSSIPFSTDNIQNNKR